MARCVDEVAIPNRIKPGTYLCVTYEDLLMSISVRAQRHGAGGNLDPPSLSDGSPGYTIG